MNEQQKQIVAHARSMVGMPWRHQARGGGRTDCAGLVLIIAREQGFIDWDIPTDYERVARPEAMINICRKYLVEVPFSEMQPGDMAVLRYPATNHIGIVGDYPVPSFVSLIHAQASEPRQVVENRLDADWLKTVGARLIGCFRFPEKVT